MLKEELKKSSGKPTPRKKNVGNNLQGNNVSDLSIYTNTRTDRRKDPFRSKPIPKSRIKWTIDPHCYQMMTLLGVLIIHLNLLLCMTYLNKINLTGVGITTKGNTGWGVKIQDLFDGKHPNYPHWKLQERIIRNGYIKQVL